MFKRFKMLLMFIFLFCFFLGDITPAIATIGDVNTRERTIQFWYEGSNSGGNRAPDYIMFNPEYYKTTAGKKEVNLYEEYKNLDPKKSSYYNQGGMPGNKKWHLTTFVRPSPDGKGTYTFQVYTPEEYGIADDWYKYGGNKGDSGNLVRYVGTWPGGNKVFSQGDNIPVKWLYKLMYENRTNHFKEEKLPEYYPIPEDWNLKNGSAPINKSSYKDYSGKETGYFKLYFPKENKTHNYEFRYWGYSVDGLAVANPMFPGGYSGNEKWEDAAWIPNPWEKGLEKSQSVWNKERRATKDVNGNPSWIKQFLLAFPEFMAKEKVVDGNGKVHYLKTMEQKIQFWNSVFQISQDGDKYAIHLKGWHKQGGRYYYKTFIVSAPEPPNIKITRLDVIDKETGKKLTPASQVLEDKTVFNKNPDTLEPGKTYIIEAEFLNVKPPVHPTTVTPIKADVYYSYDNTRQEHNIYDEANEMEKGGGILSYDMPNSIPPGGKAHFRWEKTIPLQVIDGKTGKPKQPKEGVTITVKVPKAFRDAGDDIPLWDSHASVGFNFKSDKPNLVVAAPNHQEVKYNNQVKNNIEVYKKEANGSLTLISHDADKDGYNGTVVAGEEYIFRAYVWNQQPPTHPTVNVGIELDRTTAYNGNADATGKVDEEVKGLKPVAPYTNTSLPAGATAMYEWKQTIPATTKDGSLVEKVKIGVKIPTKYSTTDNFDSSDDTCEIKLKVNNSLPNLKILSESYPDKDDNGVIRTGLEIYSKKTGQKINPEKDKLVLGETYILKAYMKYEGTAAQPQTKNSNLKVEYRLSSGGKILKDWTYLTSKNYQNKVLKDGQVAVYELEFPATSSLGSEAKFEVRVPGIYKNVDNFIFVDDYAYIKFGPEVNDMEALSIEWYAGGKRITEFVPDTDISLKVTIRKKLGNKPVQQPKVLVKVVDGAGNTVKSQILTATTPLNKPGDTVTFPALDGLRTNTYYLKATAEIYVTDPADDIDPTNNVVESAIQYELDLSIREMKVREKVYRFTCGEGYPKTTLQFYIVVHNSNPRNYTAENVKLQVRDDNARVLVEQVINIPPNVDLTYVLSLDDFQLRAGTTNFTAIVNPPPVQVVEYSPGYSDPLWNNRKADNIYVECTTPVEQIPCELGGNTTKQNTWQETFYMAKKTGTMYSYDCSYKKDGVTVRKTCYACKNVQWTYWTETRDYYEQFSVKYVYFRSKVTKDKYGGDGWVNILGNGKYGEVAAGQGFELRIVTNYNTNRINMPETWRKDMCNYQTRTPGVTARENVTELELTLPFKDNNGNPQRYIMKTNSTYMTANIGSWYNNTKEFQLPPRWMFNKVWERKIYINENAKTGSEGTFKVVTKPFSGYEYGTKPNQKKLQDCVTFKIRVVQGYKDDLRTHIVN